MSSWDPDQESLLDATHEVRTPRQFRVLLLNDDYTTFDWVVHVLVTIFRKSPSEAERITRLVHHEGQGECGVYTKDIAETKIEQVHHESRSAGFPLKCSMEPV